MSFEVICIDHDEHHPHIKADPRSRPMGPSDPQIGDICEVINTRMAHGVLFYQFAGYGAMGYDTANFAPCNGPDEVVLLEERTDAEIARLEADYQELLGEEFAVTPVDDAVVARIWHNIEAKLNL